MHPTWIPIVAYLWKWAIKQGQKVSHSGFKIPAECFLASWDEFFIYYNCTNPNINLINFPKHKAKTQTQLLLLVCLWCIIY